MHSPCHNSIVCNEFGGNCLHNALTADGVENFKCVSLAIIIWLTVILNYHVKNRMFVQRKYNQNIYLKLHARDISVKFDAHQPTLWQQTKQRMWFHFFPSFPCVNCNVCNVKSDQAFSLFMFNVRVKCFTSSANALNICRHGTASGANPDRIIIFVLYIFFACNNWIVHGPIVRSVPFFIVVLFKVSLNEGNRILSIQSRQKWKRIQQSQGLSGKKPQQ